MKKLANYTKYFYIIGALFIGCLFFYITYKTPLAGDDWGYALNGISGNPIELAISFYNSWSGRFFSELWGFMVAPNKWIWNIVNPLLFVLGSVFTSIIFTFILYSMCSVLGNVGKVLGIVLLVLQIGGSGGTFPIQLTPKFFQTINPFLPFTYAISFAREAIGGVVQSVLVKDIIVLLIYGAIFILISLFLKKPINKLSEGFAESIKKSGIGE